MKHLNRNARILLLMGCISGVFAVAIGAFGAHALKPILEATGRADVFETANRYQFYHSIAILTAGLLSLHLHYKKLLLAGYCFVAGIFFFSGSLYAISIWPGMAVLGPITPIGGLLLIVGWIFMGWTVVQDGRQPGR